MLRKVSGVSRHQRKSRGIRWPGLLSYPILSMKCNPNKSQRAQKRNDGAENPLTN